MYLSALQKGREKGRNILTELVVTEGLCGPFFRVWPFFAGGGTYRFNITETKKNLQWTFRLTLWSAIN